ncbi:hypothetical protein VTN31DRAFT_4223 [Thermomyces dupontii]|uniref:uncharacterized protein n=1 Tax=Talaromyces thermophilus TaxID=28565 RepID=UPI0037447D4E
MPFSHHSHSGQFCSGHAKDSLEEVVQKAIAQGMRVFCLTEHMPRDEIDFYPEERTELQVTEQWMLDNEVNFFREAQRLREKYASQIQLIIGFEIDWIRPESLGLIERSLQRLPFEMFVGSVHHVHTIPIDYDTAMYRQARDAAGGTEERLFEDYFDAQFEMLKSVRPPVVGHFDLIRLKSENPDATFTQYVGVWERILRNLRFVAEYGGMLELNSAALRKGMAEPYPKAEICKEFLALGGRFCLSDDSHGVAQVGFGYRDVFGFLDQVGITTVHHLSLSESAGEAAVDQRFPSTVVRSVPVEELKQTWLAQQG